MGRDKGSICLQRKRLLTRIREEISKTTWPVHVLRKDSVKRCGPLGGIYTALKKCRAEAVLFIACDMPFISAALLKRIAQAMKPGTAAVFTKQDKFAGFPFALRECTIEHVKRQIETGDFSLQTLARYLRAKSVRAKKSELFDIDTPEALASARKHLKSRTASRHLFRRT